MDSSAAATDQMERYYSSEQLFVTMMHGQTKKKTNPRNKLHQGELIQAREHLIATPIL